MNGLPSIGLNFSQFELEELKGRVVTGQATPQDLIKLILEIEHVQTQFNKVQAWIESYQSLAEKINTECYNHDPNINRIQDWTDELKYGLGPPRGVNIDHMLPLMAQVLHKVDVTGAVQREDKIILEIRRLMYDADLIKRR